jgi:TRAP-type C4-dicarboxylate transport system permease small subunit
VIPALPPMVVELVMARLSPRGRRLLDVVRNVPVTAFCLVLLPVAIRATRDVHTSLGWPSGCR